MSTSTPTQKVRIWHTNTYRLENTLNYGMERAWSIAVLKGTQKVGLGYDEGMVLIKIGKEAPVASMDNGGKIIWSRHNEIQTVNVKTASEIVDGERLPLATKELGSCEIYPQSLKHAPNGRSAMKSYPGHNYVTASAEAVILSTGTPMPAQ